MSSNKQRYWNAWQKGPGLAAKDASSLYMRSLSNWIAAIADGHLIYDDNSHKLWSHAVELLSNEQLTRVYENILIAWGQTLRSKQKLLDKVNIHGMACHTLFSYPKYEWLDQCRFDVLINAYDAYCTTDVSISMLEMMADTQQKLYFLPSTVEQANNFFDKVAHRSLYGPKPWPSGEHNLLLWTDVINYEDARQIIDRYPEANNGLWRLLTQEIKRKKTDVDPLIFNLLDVAPPILDETYLRTCIDIYLTQQAKPENLNAHRLYKKVKHYTPDVFSFMPAFLAIYPNDTLEHAKELMLLIQQNKMVEQQYNTWSTPELF